MTNEQLDALVELGGALRAFALAETDEQREKCFSGVYHALCQVHELQPPNRDFHLAFTYMVNFKQVLLGEDSVAFLKNNPMNLPEKQLTVLENVLNL